MRAIISVSDKTGVTEFAMKLEKLDFEIFSTGGTKKALTEAGVPVKSVSDIAYGCLTSGLALGRDDRSDIDF